MHNDDDVASASDTYGFIKPGEVYVVYLKNGGTTDLDLSGGSGRLNVAWFDPRHGGDLQRGTVESVEGGGVVSLGQPPGADDQDWVILIRK